ncbi:uncharacterized protein LOC109503137 isoform X1 [Felis catus]|uniref:uncharacterized protein LOC109503137 isoform X1 n=1 Tax=Felis catus TaxID=9685 RepID=UPI001D19D3E3|nr:uncharacterized protein LOC109503137 isoform X1 [Felis catus]
MLPWLPLPPLKAPGTESVFLDASPSPPCGWPGARNRHLVSHPMTQVPFAPLVPFYRQPLWAGNETALGSRPSRTAAGRGGRGSILDALWTREKPWSRSPQKPLFQLWRPTSDHQPGAGAAVGATPGGGTPGSWWGGGSWVLDQGAGRREDLTRLGRRAMNGGRVIEPSCAGTVGTARLFLPVPLARHTYYSLAGSPFFRWNTWQEPKMRNTLDGPALRSPHSTPFLPQNEDLMAGAPVAILEHVAHLRVDGAPKWQSRKMEV